MDAFLKTLLALLVFGLISLTAACGSEDGLFLVPQPLDTKQGEISVIEVPL